MRIEARASLAAEVTAKESDQVYLYLHMDIFSLC